MGLMKKASGDDQPGQPAEEQGAATDEQQPDQASGSGEAGAVEDNSEQNPAPDNDESEESEGEGAQGGSPGGGADEDDTSAQDTGQPGSPADDTGGGPAAGEDLQSIPAKPQQQAEYNRANQMLYQTLYQNNAVGSAIVKGLQPTHKVESVVRAATLLVDQIDKKLNLDQAIILPFTKDVVAHVIEVGQQVKQLQFSDDEANAALGATLQAVLHIFGVTKAQAQKFMEHMTPQDQKSALNTYHSTLAKSVAATKPDQQAQQPQQGQPQQGQPAAQGGGGPQPAAQGDESGESTDGGGDADGGGQESAEGDQGSTGGMLSQAQQQQGGQQ